MSPLKFLFFCAAALMSVFPAFSQEKKGDRDSLVSLLSAKSMELIEKDGVDYRKVTGPARFLHNNTYLVCDTALWNVNTDVIEAIGNVKIIQDGTVLSGDRLTYIVAQDLAQFRGNIVQLEDKDRNMLRTRHLDYNTRDSLALFRDGGAMKDKDGQIIESMEGFYDSKIKTFTFLNNVNMFTDSIFVKTTKLDYRSDAALATFSYGTDAWRDDYMLSSDAGWYDRNQELFLFHDHVHGMSGEQEAWADSVYYNRRSGDVEMLGNAQVTDTTRSASALGGRIFYQDSLSKITMTRYPAIVGVTDTTGTARDTVYVGADTLTMRTILKYRIDSLEFRNASARLADISADAVSSYRKSAYEEAQKAAREALAQDEDYVAEQQAREKREAAAAAQREKESAAADSLAPADSLGGLAPADSLGGLAPAGILGLTDSLVAATGLAPADSLAPPTGLAPADSLAPPTGLAPADTVLAHPLDTTKVAFVEGRGNVRMYGTDFQMRAGELKFNELDSLLRLYKEPLVWNDGNRQYAADSMYVSFGDESIERAYLMSDAFVTVEEAPQCYDQVRSTEMLAYFDSGGKLRRFDATGGVDAVFYIKEDSTYATVNKSQSRLLTAVLKDGTLDDVYYFDEVKNNGYPLAQMSDADKQLKGFNWKPELKPSGPSDITVYKLRQGQRLRYASRPKARFTQTDIYFPGYIRGVYDEISEREARKDSLRIAEDLGIAEDLETRARADSLAAADSLEASGAVADSLAAAVDSGAAEPADSVSTGLQAGADIHVADEYADSTAAAGKASLKRQKAAERQRAKEERWARLDSLDAAKAAAKAEKKAEKARQKKLKLVLSQEKEARRDAERLEKYRKRYEKKYARRKKSADAAVETKETEENPSVAEDGES